MRARTTRSAIVRAMALASGLLVMFGVSSVRPLQAADADLPLNGDQTLPGPLELGLLDLRDETRPASPIANHDLSTAVSRVGSGRAAGSHVVTEGNLILVDIRHSLSVDGIEEAIDADDGRLHRHISDAYVEAFVPAERMRFLQDRNGIISIELPRSPVDVGDSGTLVPLAGSVTSQSVAKANAPAWHAAGYTGSGVAIGIIDSFDGAVWDQARASGDVPNPASTYCRVGGVACDLWSAAPGAEHGTAVAEVVHDMAPSSSLHLADAGTPGDYVGVIDHFASQGVSVVNHSRTWSFDGPGDGTGVAAAIVNYAASKGMLWVNAAGNYADGGYWRGVWADANANDWHDFSPGDETMGFYCDPGLGLRWDDWPSSNPTDYDVYIFDDPESMTLKAVSLSDQTQDGVAPLEIYGNSLLAAGCAGSGDIDYLAIHLHDAGDGAVGDILELGIGSLGQYWTSDHSAAVPFADSFSPSMLSVGAVDPPSGTAAATYSSWGPTNDGRTKPDLSAAAGVTSFTYGSFSGTSASAPAVVGAVALLFQAGVISSAIDGVDYLSSGATTVDRGDPGTDNIYGIGELVLPTPPPVPPPAAEELVGLVDPSTGTWHLRGADGSITSFFYGNPGDHPFVGDWDCDGTDTPGLYRQSDGFAYLRNSNSQGNADIRFFFGNPGDIPMSGDFDGDGCDTVSIYRPAEARIYVINALGSNDGGLGAADFDYIFGNPGDKPFTGDFDGDGVDTLGLHRESTGFVYFRQSNTQGTADAEFFFGDPGDRLVSGDWGIIDGVDSPAIFRPASSTFYFRHTNTQGNADSQISWGSPTWSPVAGDF